MHWSSDGTKRYYVIICPMRAKNHKEVKWENRLLSKHLNAAHLQRQWRPAPVSRVTGEITACDWSVFCRWSASNGFRLGAAWPTAEKHLRLALWQLSSRTRLVLGPTDRSSAGGGRCWNPRTETVGKQSNEKKQRRCNGVCFGCKHLLIKMG